MPTNISHSHERAPLEPEDVDIIINLCRILNSALNHETLILKIMEFCTKAMRVDGVSILLHNDAKDKLIFYCTTGDKSEILKKITLDTNEGIAGWVFTHNTPVLSNSVHDDPRFAARVDDQSNFETHSIIGVPLNLDNATIGVLELVNKQSADGFSARDLVLSELIAEHAALALERVRLIQNNIATSRLAAIGETVAGLAHYIKNILTALEGSAFLVSETLQQEDSNFELIYRQWPIIDRSIQNISSLALSMLEFSKERKPSYTRNNINRIIAELADLMHEKARKYQIQFSITLDESIPDTYFDAQGIHRVLLNLISNSFDACSGVQTPILSIRSHKNGADELKIILRDTGAGMPAEVLEKIMTSKVISTKGSRGTGLGLPISRKIIQEHNGRFDILSESGKGTEITISLPIVREPSV